MESHSYNESVITPDDLELGDGKSGYSSSSWYSWYNCPKSVTPTGFSSVVPSTQASGTAFNSEYVYH